MDDDGLYPVQATENQYSDGYVQQINVISSDNDLVQIVDGGKITSSGILLELPKSLPDRVLAPSPFQHWFQLMVLAHIHLFFDVFL